MIFKDIQIVKRGTDKEGDYFSTNNIKKIADIGNSKETKCRWGHPKEDQNGSELIVGKWKNYRLEGDRVLADLEVLDIAKNVKINDSNAYEVLEWFHNNEPSLVGVSVCYNRSKELKESRDPNEIDHYWAADIVDIPAVNDGLFKSLTKNKDKDMIYKDILEGINKMITGKLNESKQKDVEINLANGTTATASTTDDIPKVGDRLMLDGKPAPDGEHKGADGMIYVIIGGIIDEIKEPEATEETIQSKDLSNETLETLKSLAEGLQFINDNVKNLESRIKEIENSTVKEKETEQEKIKELKKEFDVKMKELGNRFESKGLEDEPQKKREVKITRREL